MRSAVALVLLSLVATGCGREAAAQGDGGSKKLRVSVVRPERRDMVHRLDLPGDVEGIERAALHARSAGFVREMHVDLGDEVKRDQVLVVVEAPDLDARRARAKAALASVEADARAAVTAVPRAKALLEETKVELDRAKAERSLRDVTLERKKQLVKEGGVTVQELDEAEAAAVAARAVEKTAEARIETAQATLVAAEATAESARAHVETARAALAEVETEVGFTEVKAPFDGVVIERRVDPGAFVPPPTSSSSMPLLVVARTDVVRVWIDVPESDAALVASGRPALVARSFATGTKPLEAKIARFAGGLDAATRTLRVAIDVKNVAIAGGDAPLRPGAYVHARLDLETRASVPTLPADALIVKKGKTYVFVVEDGKAHRKKIATGADDGARVEVVAGIAADALVVTEGKSAVSENAEVEAVEAKPGDGSR